MELILADNVLDAVSQAGMQLDREPEPGRLHRFSPTGRNGDKPGWIKVFPDGDGGVFGCWREGVAYTWQRRPEGPPPDAAELAAIRARAQEARKAAETEREASYQEAARKAAATWQAASPAQAHPYLSAKGIGAHIARERNGSLVLPVFDNDSNIQSVQSVSSAGEKRFMPGGKMAGGRCWIGEPTEAGPLVLCEGFATGATMREATGWPVCVTFTAGNLRPVACDVRERFPRAQLVMAGDDDRHTAGNPGRTKALEAAKRVQGYAAFPSFDGDQGTDFNDVAQQAGLDAVREQIVAAVNPQSEPPTDDQDDNQGDGTGDALLGQHTRAIAFVQPALAAADVRDGTDRTRPLTEHGNALRLLDLHRDRVRYVREVSGWLVWRDGGWTWDPDGADVRMAAAALPQSIYAEGVGCKVTDAEHFARWARHSQSMRVVQAAVQMLSDQRSIRVPMAHIDADPMLVGYADARRVIDLRTGKSRPAAPGDYITKALAVSEIGDAEKAVRWLAFLDQIFEGDAELIDWLHRWAGYMLTGSTAEQLLVFCFGLGANGKSVLGELLRWIAGDYARALPVETLCESRRQAGGASPDLADLAGARLALSTETEDGQALAESLIKALTAGDTISARPLYGKPFNFAPQFKLLMLGNHRPVVRGTDHGIWRRIRLVPFNRTFGPDERDPHLLDKLKAEAPHILAWMVQGALEWQRRGLADTPRVVAAATADFQVDQDVIGQWLAEETERNVMDEVAAGDLYASYRAWAIESGLKPASKVALGRRMGERGFRYRRSNGQTRWMGLRLKPKSGAGYGGGYGR